ncbi:hypothetical protein [Marinicella meishanensis]|uniref:hypothetical protein n=1 Tax=Marinicella meishanensis TaxID=2873263 RepID=UPI001CBA8B71|nr:hypothetical protein [Marinicella sp. NBU2979]
MEWQSAKKIDQALYRFIDPEQPLLENDVFLPSVDFSVIELIWVVFWVLVFATGVLGISYGLIDQWLTADHAQLMQGSIIAFNALLVAACLFGAYKTWRSFYWKLFRRRLFKAGRYRHGLFVLEDGLLLHSMSQICLIDKSRIRRLHVVHKGRGDPLELLLILHKNGQENVHINLKMLQLSHTATELERSLCQWINSGVWKIN